MFFGLYGPVFNREREVMWLELGNIRWSELWCIRGDFNVIKFPREEKNCLRNSAARRHIVEIIYELQLRDLPLAGGFLLYVEAIIIGPLLG